MNSISTKKFVAGFAGFAIALSLVLGAAAPAQAATVAELQAMIASLQAQLSSSSAPAATVSYTFTRNLSVGSKGADVKNLQVVLNSNPATQVAASGVGSAGKESSTFGPATKAAVIKFQKLNSIPATGTVGPLTRAALALVSSASTPVTTTPGTTPAVTVTPVGTNVVATLASDSPASGVIVAGQAIADLAHFKFTNSTASNAVVNGLVFNRTGVSNDTTLSNVYLYNGVNRLTDSATVSQSRVTFNDSSGLFMIPAGQSIVISVKADVATGTNGQLIGVSLVSATGATVSGLPLSGSTQSISTASLGSVDFTNTTVTPSSDGSPSPQNDYVSWQKTVSIGTHDAWLRSFRLRQIGSVYNNDLANFRLYVDGNMVGSAVPSLDSKGYITFDLSANPVKLGTGSRTIKLLADIVGGSTRTFSFSLRQASDIEVIDSQLNVPVLPVVGSSSFSAMTSTAQTVQAGSLTITKTSDSPSGNVTLASSQAVLGRFELKAAGEPIKVENLLVSVSSSAGGSTASSQVTKLRNGAIFADGVQVGSTADINEDSNTTTSTQFNLGSALVVTPGKPVKVEVRADIYDNDGTDSTAAGQTLAANLEVGSSNAQKTVSLTYFNTPSAKVTGNTLTLATGGLSLAKYAAYTNRTVVKPQSAYKIAEYTVTANSTEDVNLNSFTLNFSGASASSTASNASNITDVYLVVDGTPTSPKNTIVAGDNTFSVNKTLKANGTINVAVYGNIGAGFGSSDVINTTLAISGQTSNSAQTANASAVTGQVVTLATGTMATPALVNDSTTATQLMVGGTTQKVGSFRFTSTNDSFTVTDIAVKVASANAAAGVRSVTLKSGSTVLGSGFQNISASNYATTTGLSLVIPANDPAGRVVDVYLNLNDVNSNAATTSNNVAVTLDAYKSLSSTGTTNDVYSLGVSGNAQYVYKSIPTITNVVLPSSTLSAGSGQTIYKFKVAADAAGQINWKKVVFTINKTAAITLGATSTDFSLVDSNNNTIAGTFATSTATVIPSGLDAFGTAATSGTLSFVATNEQEITSSETYSLKANVGGLASGYNFVAVSIANPSTSATTPSNTYSVIGGAAGTQTPSFVWSDRSANSHSVTTADWNNDYKVKTLPTDAVNSSVSI